MILWNGQGGRKYPIGVGFTSPLTMQRWPSRGTSGAVVITFQPVQTLTLNIGLEIRGGIG